MRSSKIDVFVIKLFYYYLMSLKNKKANIPANADEMVKTTKYTWLEKYPKKKVVIKPAARLESEYNNWNIPVYFPLSD